MRSFLILGHVLYSGHMEHRNVKDAANHRKPKESRQYSVDVRVQPSLEKRLEILHVRSTHVGHISHPTLQQWTVVLLVSHGHRTCLNGCIVA